MPVRFPHPDEANEDGIVAIGGHLDAETLEEAYLHGIFPWPIEENYPMTWFSPDPRGLVEVNDIHYPKSFQKFLKNHPYEVRFNEDFSLIVENCAKVKRKGQKSTWIFEGIKKGYKSLFDKKKAYCVGVYEDEVLVAGIYGVCIGEIISGESMFHKRDNTSKLALYSVLECLRQAKIPFLDTQMVTEVVASFGGKEISRNEYLKKLERLDKSRSRDDIFSMKD